MRRPYLKNPLISGSQLVAIAVATICYAGSEATAQSIEWNRKADRLLVVPSVAGPAGNFDITMEWRLEMLAATGASSDAGTEAALFINATELGSQTIPATDPGITGGGGDPSACVAGCGAACGGMTVDGSATAMTCTDNIGSCTCQTPTLSVTFPGVSLVVEDEIMVLLRPAPGALPDPLPNDDRAELTFGSWNRRMVSILVEPATAGAGLFDLTASWVLDVNHDLTVDVEVGVSAELSVNTTPTGNSDNPVCIIWDIKDSCEHSCATDPDGAVCGDAIISGQTELLTCNAGHDACETPLFEIVFPAVPLMPGDEIMVLLRPAPGALPELPTNDDFLMVVHAVSGVPASSRASIVILLATVIGIGIAMTKRRRGLRVR